MRTKQFLILLGGFALVILIYRFGKTKTLERGMSAPETSQLQFDTYETLQLSVLPTDDAERIRQLQSNVNASPDQENYLALSRAWEETGNYPLGAFYYHEAVAFDSDSIDWETAGDKFMVAYNNYGDSLISNNLLTFAVSSFKKARASNRNDLEIRMKLAETYVESPDPMKGIVILRELADSIPEYVPAQMRLGRLSLQTGQYERAAGRFQTVLEDNPVNTEAMYFLGLANEGMGNAEEAIRLFELCKQLVNNPAFTEEIDVYIDKLKQEVE